jgi:hypothetical protein
LPWYHFCLFQASGVAVQDDCVRLFNELKLKHDKKYIIFNMNDKMTEIQVQISCLCDLDLSSWRICQDYALYSGDFFYFCLDGFRFWRLVRKMRFIPSLFLNFLLVPADMECLMSSTPTPRLVASAIRLSSSPGIWIWS